MSPYGFCNGLPPQGQGFGSLVILNKAQGLFGAV